LTRALGAVGSKRRRCCPRLLQPRRLGRHLADARAEVPGARTAVDADPLGLLVAKLGGSFFRPGLEQAGLDGEQHLAALHHPHLPLSAAVEALRVADEHGVRGGQIAMRGGAVLW
jgi:hypothetical protein